MKLVSGIVDSGFFAQSALSAEVATKDSIGRNISETYLTGVDLTPYQTVEGMTAYQSAGEYYSASNPSGFLVADNITGKLDASVYAKDSGNFLTAVPDTYLQNTDLEISDNKVTGISGIPLAAGGGGDVPEGVMAESGLEYNAVDEISGYNGSAFAQYGAEKQWLVHDDTLVHASNSAQYALGVNLSAIAQLLGVDETVLWSGNVNTYNGYLFNLPEPITNFKSVKVYAADEFGWTESIFEFDPNYIGSENRWSHCLDLTFNTKAVQTNGQMYFRGIMLTANEASVNSATQISAFGYENTGKGTCTIQKIIGIGRKQ